MHTHTCTHMHAHTHTCMHTHMHTHSHTHTHTLAAVFRVISAVLHFGNLKFKQERSSDQALLVDDTIAQKISKLLGMPVTEFTKALLKPKIKTGREFTVRSQNMAQVGGSHTYM